MQHKRSPAIAYFVSPHGFGHASRACSVMDALHRSAPDIHFHIFTTVPEWFFHESLQNGPFSYHHALTDIGLVQKSPFEADLRRTVEALDTLLPIDEKKLTGWTDLLGKTACGLIICDIAPIGIAVARRLGIPSVLVENFTWDWIYETYIAQHPRLAEHQRFMQDIFKQADVHIQTQPICQHSNADLTVGPAWRIPRQTRSSLRERLGIPETSKMVLVTSGGIPVAQNIPEPSSLASEIYIVLSGAYSHVRRSDRVIYLPHHSAFFHPDLVQAADAAIGKVGYSTLAEVYQFGLPFGYVARESFRESRALVDFVRAHLHGIAISEAHFASDKWLAAIIPLLDMPPVPPPASTENGAHTIAGFLMERFL